jgi:carboxypeptidase Taq
MWTSILSILCDSLDGDGDGDCHSVPELYASRSHPLPLIIRVEADEVTYPMHVILRFELEQGLFDGSVSTKDLPTLWNAKMKDLLGVEVPSDAKGK